MKFIHETFGSVWISLFVQDELLIDHWNTTKDYQLEYYYSYNLFHKNILLIPEEAYWPSDCISWLSFEARLTQKYIWNFLWFDRYLPKSCQEKLRKNRGIGC